MANELIGIDIAHGENTFDTGSKGVKVNGVGYEEHHSSARIALLLDKMLKHNGFRTTFAQQPYQNDVPLNQRTNFYDAQKVDLGFSIHHNAGPSSARGLCAFYWNSSKEGFEAADDYADLVKEYGYPQYSGGLEPSRLNHWTNFAMLRDTDAVWLLTENGFMTNPEDFEFIFGSKKEKFAYDIAEIHAKVACAFFKRDFKPLSSGQANSTPIPAQEVKGVISIGKGSSVTVKSTATHYETGQPIATHVKGSKYTVLQVKGVNKGYSKKAYLLSGIVSWVLEQDISESGVKNGYDTPTTPAPAPKPAPVAPKKRYVVLPRTANEWRIYPLDKAPVVKNALPNRLKPAKFGGLTYEILKDHGGHVYEIKTGDFGRVKIYGAPITGASIITK
ncbi:hypothetical protein [Microcystis phage MaeS]|nr:hypothetical protein [Microcystis phage MaeS]